MSNIILCPTRGGQASYPNQDRAIALARARGAKLLFLYVSDVRFLGLSASPKVVDIQTEMDEVGDFLLTMAQERAANAGVQADTILRHGAFRAALIDVIDEHQVDTVVLGTSAGGTGIVTEEYVQGLVDEIGGATQVEFVVVDRGEVIKTYQSSPGRA